MMMVVMMTIIMMRSDEILKINKVITRIPVHVELVLLQTVSVDLE